MPRNFGWHRADPEVIDREARGFPDTHVFAGVCHAGPARELVTQPLPGASQRPYAVRRSTSTVLPRQTLQ
eukprot:6195132-Heterocapsa_arctica.AAC.1